MSVRLHSQLQAHRCQLGASIALGHWQIFQLGLSSHQGPHGQEQGLQHCKGQHRPADTGASSDSDARS